MSIAVVVWHLGGVPRSGLFKADEFANHVFDWSDFVNFHVLLLAVPTFILVSDFLLVRNPVSALRRMRRIFALMVFWVAAYKVYRQGPAEFLLGLPRDLPGLWHYVMSGGSTIFYFFFSLIVSYVFVVVAVRLPTAINVALCAISTAALAVIPLAAPAIGANDLSTYQSPLNFIPYAFAATIVDRCILTARPDQIGKTILALAVLAFALGVYEWHYFPNAFFIPSHSYAMPAYTRPSLVPLCSTLLIVSLQIKREAPPVIAFMSRYSLALYCLHLFMIVPVRAVTGSILNRLGSPQTTTLIQIVCVIALSYLVAAAIARTPLRRIVL